MGRSLLCAMLAVSLLSSTAGLAGAAAPPASHSVSASAESEFTDAQGVDHYLHVVAERSGHAVTVRVDGLTQGPIECADGSSAYQSTLVSGSASGSLEVSGPLDHAEASARMDLSVETLAGCPGTVGDVVVLPDRPVALSLDATAPPLRVLTSARMRVPSERNDLHIERQTVRNAEGTLTVDTASNPTFSGVIERTHVVVHGGDPQGLAATDFLTALASAQHTRSTILQARGVYEEVADEVPPVGGVLGRFVDVTAETVDRTSTTVYAAAVTDTVIACADGGLGVLSTQRFGSAPGTLDVTPRYASAAASAQAPLTEYRLDGCTGEISEHAVGTQPIGLALDGTGPVFTATDFRVFGTAGVHGHQRVSITGRTGVSGTIRVGELTVAPTDGGIGLRRAVSHGPAE